MRKTVSFFKERFRYKPTEEDLLLISGIVNQLKEIHITEWQRFSEAQQKFVDSLAECLMDAYAMYCASHTSSVYLAYREHRATWKDGALDNGPEEAEKRRWWAYWRGKSAVNMRDVLLGELVEQLLNPLSSALREGVLITKDSRTDVLLRFLKKDLSLGIVYPTVPSALEAIQEQSQSDIQWLF